MVSPELPGVGGWIVGREPTYDTARSLINIPHLTEWCFLQIMVVFSHESFDRSGWRDYPRPVED